MRAEFKARKEKMAKNVGLLLSCYELSILQTGEKDGLKNSYAEGTVFCNDLGNALPRVTPHIPSFQTDSLKR